MPQKDKIHNFVKDALIKEGWLITDITYDKIFNEPIGKLVINDLP